MAYKFSKAVKVHADTAVATVSMTQPYPCASIMDGLFSAILYRFLVQHKNTNQISIIRKHDNFFKDLRMPQLQVIVIS